MCAILSKPQIAAPASNGLLGASPSLESHGEDLDSKIQQVWYQSCSLKLKLMSWVQFCEAIRARFSNESHENIVGEFKQLVQTASVQEYQNQFEELQPLMLIANPGLSESYFVHSFISGLKEEIKHTVQMFNPSTLSQAITLTKQHETTIECSPHHEIEPDRLEATAPPFMPEEPEVAISLHALSGNSTFHTLKLQGQVKNQSITMLIDSGSTHNFVDINTAKKLGCKLCPISTHSVAVAGGGRLSCQFTCPKFSWTIQGHHLESEACIINLGGCDLVLGVQRLKAVGPLTMDFSQLSIQIHHQDKLITLLGSSPTQHLELMSLSAISSYAARHPTAVVGFLFAIEGFETTSPDIPAVAQPLLHDFADIFAEPSSLPPPRHCDHQIQLKQGEQLVHIRQYRYPQVQKAEIER